MPLIDSNYRTSPLLFNGHLETIFPYLYRPEISVHYHRERMELTDGDFLDLDWLKEGRERLAILCHGLEGSSDSQYMKGMAKALHAKGWDVLAINFRSCSGEMNRLLRMYHHGEIEDLTSVIDYVIQTRDYQAISLCGFSLGGNVIIKYLGTQGSKVPLIIRSAMAVSVPCDLASSSQALDRWSSYFYTRRFRRSLRKKFELKNRMFPGTLDLKDFEKVKSWYDFDSKYTTRLTSFDSADYYYTQGSANNYIAGVRTTTLLINAANDPFLKSPSYPYALCEAHPYVSLEIPTRGGHVGFWYPGLPHSYLEDRASEFFDQHI
ncbi:MAG: alpha/beta fold hydrolase [Saprospiraceae bacterium]|nr:alpha/beta fold hydrolase [Saprospiraceae bacterium]